MSTTLSNLIGRMNAYTPINNKDEVLKVNAIDEAIRWFRANNQPPWTLKKTTIRIFEDVLLYPTATDHAQLAFLMNQKMNVDFSEQPRYIFSSIKDFLENPDYRNLMAEVWDTGVKMLGIRDKTAGNLTSTILQNADDASDWTASGDAGTPVLDNVNFITGQSSIRVPITNSTGTATIQTALPNAIVDANYQRKYFFAWVYLDGLPSAISLRFGADSSNYLSASVTAQFSGQPFKADDWNLLAFDLNTATPTGTINTATSFDYQAFVLTNAPTGNYYFDASYIRGWILQDYWYYSTYNVLDGSTYQEFFAPDGATYDVTAVLIGDTVWHDIVVYRADMFLLADEKEKYLRDECKEKLADSWENYRREYPDESPRKSTQVYRFETDYQTEMGPDDLNIF